MTEQQMCCGTTCCKKTVGEYIKELEDKIKDLESRKTVDQMFEHFAPSIEKTRCKMLTINSIKEWRDEE